MRIRVNEHITLKRLSRYDAADIFYTINAGRSYLGKWLTFVAI